MVHDRVTREVLWNALEKKKVCMAYILTIKNMYDVVITSVRTQSGVTKNFLKF